MEIPRKIRFFFQRLWRGWDDSDTWSLDMTIAKFVLPRLIRFKELEFITPSNDLKEEEWNEILDKMIVAFKYYTSDDQFRFNIQDFPEVEEGMILFSKHFNELWN